MMGYINRDGENVEEPKRVFPADYASVEAPQAAEFDKSQFSFYNVRQQLSQRHNPIHRALSRRKVSEIMTQPVITAPSDVSLGTAWKIFKNNRISYIPIVGPNLKYIGMVSARGILYQKMESDDSVSDDLLITRFMVQNILVASPDTNVKQIALTLINKRVGAVPILDSEDVPVGIITSSDVLKAFFMAKSPLDFTA